VFLSAPGAAYAQNAKACRFIKVTELPFKFEDNKALVEIRLNGQTAWFAIDTGADDSSMFGGAARALGLRETSEDGVRFYGVGGAQDAKAVIISEFGLGAVKVKNVKLYSIGSRGSAGFAGLLGLDFLDRVGDMEFDIAAHTLRFWKPENCRDRSLAYWTKSPMTADITHAEAGSSYIVKLVINGRPVDAELDSGSDTTVVTPEIARTLAVSKDKFDAEVRKTSGIGEHLVEARVAMFDSVQVGDEQIKNARLQVADLFAADKEMRTGSILPGEVDGVDMPKMLLGADFLRSHRVLIATEQGLLYFTYNGGPVFQPVVDPVKPHETPAPHP